MSRNAEHAAVRLLDLMDEAAISFVVLHREHLIADGFVESDVDIVVGSDSKQLTGRLIGLAAERTPSLRCVCMWEYDRGATTSFWIDSEGGGAQLDIAGDVVGKYGFKADALVAASVQGRRWRTLNPLDATLYELRKRQLKRDVVRHRRALEEARAFPTAEQRIREAFASPAARALLTSLRTGSLGPAEPLRRWRRAIRLASRLLTPCGSWLHVHHTPGLGSPGEALHLASSICDALDPVLVHVPRPARLDRGYWFRRYSSAIARVRWRPGVAVTYGSQLPDRWGPDVSLASTESLDAAIEGLSRRAERSFLRIPVHTGG